MRFAIATLGCKVNQYDSAIIEDRLRAQGMQRAEFNEPADVYIVNTCTVTDRADAESRKLARRARRLNPAARIIATGCLAQASPEVLARVPEIDHVIGLGRLDDLTRAATAVAVATGAGAGAGERVMVSNLRKERAAIELGAVAISGQTRAFLKLQEGCDQFCTFCIVPFSRGTSRSVEPRRIFAALDDLHARGFREATLSGVHLGGYGRDLSPAIDLETLLEMIAERSPIGRVRISSLDPEELSERIISIIAGSDKFCPHLHLPLQSGDDQILAAMRRRYDTAYYRERIERVMEAMPDAAIGTDLIVGFPGETAAHFERYFKFVESLPLAYFHVFPYSVRTGTTAAKFGGRVGQGKIKEQAQALRDLGESKRAAFARRFVGARLQVLLEEREPRGKLSGYSRNYIRVAAGGPDELKNHEVEVAVSAIDGLGLAGEIISAPQGSASTTAVAIATAAERAL
ncbi:MAG: tRNA (N(6)-L-threonylcarbamoyladenosine(37)-C(2))-methylthiotransferase MtaB [Candidatus Binatales bacterium]